MKLFYSFILVLSAAACSAEKTEISGNQVAQQNNIAFTRSAAGDYIRIGTKFTIPVEASFTFSSAGNTFNYTFIKALDKTTALYEMGGKYYHFTLSGAQLRRTETSYGTPELIQGPSFMVYAIKSEEGTDSGNAGQTTGTDDSIPNIGTGSGGSSGGDTGGGSLPSSPYLNQVANQNFVRSGYYFTMKATGDFIFQGETSTSVYQFQNAISSSTAIYKIGTSYVGVKILEDGYLQMTASATRPDYVGLHTLSTYAVKDTADYITAFKEALTGPNNAYTQKTGGAVFSILTSGANPYRITDSYNGKFYNFVSALNSSNAIYKDSSANAYYGLSITGDELFFTQNFIGVASPDLVRFNNRVSFAQRNP